MNEIEIFESCENPSCHSYNKGCRCLICKQLEAARKRKNKKAVKEYVMEFKKRGCQDCGWNKNANAIVFHHIGEKTFKMSLCHSFKKVNNELSKGVFLCPNCHAIRHTDPITGKIDYREKSYR